jgi:alkylated DNA repair protein alkB family protein 1
VLDSLTLILNFILCSKLAGLVGEEMKAEAAIVNFYPVGTYMSGHLDDAEQAMEEPIVSISLGCPAIFLVGGRSRDETPTPILIRSGDVMIMSKESRYAYHGVPAIIAHKVTPNPNPNPDTENTEKPCCDICKLINCTGKHSIPKEPSGDLDKTIFDSYVLQYLAQGRININVRRVVRHNEKWVDKHGSGASY